MADLTENHPGTENARVLWRRAYDVLSGLKLKGLFLSPEDERFLEQLASRVGR